MRLIRWTSVALAACTAVGMGCSDYSDHGGRTESYGGSSSTRDWRVNRAEATVADFRRKDASLERFFDTAYGYVVMPKITKGAAGIGASHGEDGVVFEQGRAIGSAEMTQVTLGAQLGGQDFAEIIFFQNKGGLEDFKNNNVEFAANASAVAATSGAAATSDYSNGVAIFTMPLGGLMFEASIGGQKFRYTPF